MPDDVSSAFGTFLRTQMETQKVSMRRLGEACGLDPATISRLATGKQKPLPEHIDKLASALQLPAIDLWQAAGYIDRSSATPERKAGQPAAKLSPFSFLGIEGLDPTHIAAELEKYRLYAQTAEGHDTIMQSFEAKLEQVKGTGEFIQKLMTLYARYRADTVSPEQRHILGSALLYFILATDIIPDYMFPIGYLDDAMAIDMVWQQAQAWSTSE